MKTNDRNGNGGAATAVRDMRCDRICGAEDGRSVREIIASETTKLEDNCMNDKNHD